MLCPSFLSARATRVGHIQRLGFAMTMKLIGLTGLAALLALMGACSDSDTNPGEDDGAGGSGNSTTTTGGSGGGTGGDERNDCTPKDGCDPPEPAHLGDMATVTSITALYIDQDGNPAEGVQTTACGTNLCSEPADSDASGAVTVTADSMFTDPRFNAGHNAYGYAKFSGLIPTTPVHDFGTVRVIRMPAFSSGVAINPGETATQGGVSLTLAADAELQHSCVDYPDENQRGLRGAVVDVRTWTAAETPQIDASLGIEVIVVAMPLGTHICPAAEMTFDNEAGYAASSEVDIYINGAKTFKHYAPYGQWAKISEGVVSADGTTITTKDGMGLSTLGTFGIVPK
jgi:hypothetical protein